MKKSTVALRALLALTSFLILSCTTFRANTFVLKQITPQEKAERLFKEGLSLYNQELMENNNLREIGRIRTFFSDALKLDPMHQRAAQYLKELETFKDVRFEAYLKKARDLQAKANRTDREDYQMVLAVKQAADLRTLHAGLISLKFKTRGTRNAVIQARETAITAQIPPILAERNPQNLNRLLGRIATTLTELEAIDPNNSTAKSSRRTIDSHVATLAQRDIDSAREKLAASRFAESETEVLRAERTLTPMIQEPNTEIERLKYDLYYRWAASLLQAKRYQLAAEKINLALAIERTTAAVSLKTRISAAASIRDYDAEINDIVSSVDSLMERGDLGGAWDVIEANLPRLRVQANKNRLLAKQAAIVEKINVIYREGVALYNDEDYEEARRRFRVVVRINADYEQAQSYLDRANTKIRALTGHD